jgi:polyferredoxin
MRPMFGRATQILAVLFLLAGVGALYALLASGRQVTPGHATDRPILGVLSILFLGVAGGLWIERPWAWWFGLSISALTAVADLALDATGGGWVVWMVITLLFVVSGLTRGQGTRDEISAP